VVLGLAHLEIAVVDIEGNPQPLAGDRGEQGPAHVEVHGVAELPLLRRARGLDPRREVAGVVAAEGGLPHRPQEIAEGAVAEEVHGLLGELEANGRARLAVSAPAGGIVEGLGLRGPQIALPHEALHRLLQELVEGALVPHELGEVLVGEETPPHERLQDRVVEGLQAVLVPLPRLLAEAALEEEVGELGHEVLEVEVLPQLGDVAVIADEAQTTPPSSPAS
jgi:hypothetical protein